MVPRPDGVFALTVVNSSNSRAPLSGELLQEKLKLIRNNSPLNKEVHTFQ